MYVGVCVKGFLDKGSFSKGWGIGVILGVL